MVPSREVFWNIPHHSLMYALFALCLIFFCYGFYRRLKLWFSGKEEGPISHLSRRLLTTAWVIFSHKNVLMEIRPGIIHASIFFGFVALFIGTCIINLQVHLKWHILYGDFYLYYSLILDIFGALMLLGILLASIMRYFFKHRHIKNIGDDAVILGLLFSIISTGFLIEGSRIAVAEPPWERFSPVGYATATVIKNLLSPEGPSPTDLKAITRMHALLWWFHLVLAMGFIAYIPYSKLIHIFTGPLNIFLHSARPKGALKPLDLEDMREETLEGGVFGALSPKDFSWKQLLDGDACTRCGRCDNQCPATLAEKPLKPQKIILDVKAQMEEDMNRRLMGGRINAEEVWACTTCRACEEHCPLFIEHLQKIIDLRRGPGLTEGKYPGEILRTIKNIKAQKNPYGLAKEGREDWMRGLDIKKLSEDPKANILFWVGCSSAFDDRNQKVVLNFANLLKRMGIDFGVLGREEKCCGDPLRRVGNEMDFQLLARENIETLRKYNTREIVTCCPHCFNTLKNEYPQFGGDFKVWHHTEFLYRNKAFVQSLVSEKGNKKTITYHDPCYLGRHNDIYDVPRHLLGLLPKANLREMGRSRNRSFCCGGGGGHMWMEQKIGKNINEMRIDQALETRPDIIATACPFCLTMLTNGLKAKGVEGVEILDIIEILEGT